MNYTVANLKKEYEMELDELVIRIKEIGDRSVLLQLPDGLKPWAVCIVDYLSEGCDAEISIWLGSCFGACDLPVVDCDLVVQFGHSKITKRFLRY